MPFHRNLRANRKGIGTVFAMVFFLLIVMLVFASFMIVLNQNTSVEQTLTQNRQIDEARANEQLTITTQEATSLFSSISSTELTVNCLINNTCTLPIQIIRIWIEDLNNSATGSQLVPSNLRNLPQGQAINYTGTVNLQIADPTSDHFRFWFETARGNQFTLQASNGGIVSQADFNRQLSNIIGLFLPDYSSVQWASVTTTNGVSTVGQWQTGWIIPTGVNINAIALRMNLTYYGDRSITIDNNTNVDFNVLQQDSVVFENNQAVRNGSYYYGVYPTLYISNYEPANSRLSLYNGPGITFDNLTTPTPKTLYFSTILGWIADTSGYYNAWDITQNGNPSPKGYPINCISPNVQMSLVLYGKSPSTYAQTTALFAIQTRSISLQLNPISGVVGTSVTATGTGFAANSLVSLTLDSTSLTPTKTTNSVGGFTLTFTVPSTTQGTHTITATDSSSSHNAAIDYFSVTPSVTVSPQQGVAGGQASVYGAGFAANSHLVVTFDGLPSTTSPSNPQTDSTGSFSNVFFATQSTTPGSKTINITDASGNFVTAPFTLRLAPTVPAPTLPTTLTLGNTLTGSVLVTGASGYTPTGTVTFQVSTDSGNTWNVFGATKTLSAGSATSDTYTPPSVGNNYRFRAVYNGDTNFVSTTSTFSALTVNPAAPTVPAPTLNPLSPITLGTQLRGSVTVPGVLSITPTGTVTFQLSTDSGSTWAQLGTVKTLIGGSATSDYYLPQLASNTYQVRVVYSGDSSYNGANSVGSPLTVNKATAAISVSTFTPASPITLGSSVTVSASTTGPGGVIFPTGSVQFQAKVGAGTYANFGAAVALTSGTASISYTPSSIGTFNFQAVYLGDSNYNSGTTGPASGTLTVYVASSTSTLLSTSSPMALGGTTTDIATVTPQSYLYNQVAFIGAGAGIGGTGTSLSVAYPSGLAANDLLLLQVTVRDTTNTPSQPIGWTQLYGPDSSTIGQQWVYYKFAAGSETGTLSVTLAGANLKVARMYDFRNVAASSFTESPVFSSSPGSTTVSAQSATTLAAGRLAVSFVFDTSSNALAAFSGATGGTWSEAVSEYTTTTGSGGGIQLQTATMANAGTLSGGSFTMSSGASWGVRAFALIPTQLLPSGQVVFQALAPSGSWATYNSQTLSSGTATSVAFMPTSSGTWYFRALYTGDSNYLVSQSGDSDELLTVNPVTPTLTFSQPSYTTTVGSLITPFATVSGVGTIIPTGTLTFFYSTNGGSTWTQLGSSSPTISGSGNTASASAPQGYIPSQVAGTYLFGVTYSGDTNYNAVASKVTVSLTVNKGTANVGTTTFTPASPINIGSSVTVSAVVTSPGGAMAPTGTVQFQVKIGAGSYANFGSPASLSSGSASISYTPVTATTYSFQAVYQGDSNYVTGTVGGASSTLTVNKLDPTVTAPTLNPSGTTTAGTSISLSATITGGGTTPTGTATFQVNINGGGWTTIGSPVTLNGAGLASTTYTATTAGSNQFRVIYSGDTIYSSFTGSTSTVTVNPGVATKLVYTVVDSSVARNVRSTVFTVQRQDQYNNPVTSGAITLTLDDGTANGYFYSVPSGGTAITSITISAGSSTVNFYWEYVGTSTSSRTLTSSYTGLTSATTTVTVT
jgi:hypothetical protein